MEWISKIIAVFNAEWIQAVLVFLLLVVEFWLGKTTLVKPGSTLEAIFLGIKKFLELLKIKKPSA